MELRPGKGLGAFTFGMLPQEVIKLLGKPDKIFESEDDEEEVIYQYNALRTMLTFYKHEDEKLGYIRSSSPDIVCNGQLLLGQPVKSVLADSMKDIKEWEEENYDLFDTYMNAENWIVLNVEYERVLDIEIGVPLNDDEEYIWP